MIRLIAVAFALALASTAQATPPVQLAQPDETVMRSGHAPHRGRCLRENRRSSSRRPRRPQVRSRSDLLTED